MNSKYESYEESSYVSRTRCFLGCLFLDMEKMVIYGHVAVHGSTVLYFHIVTT